MPFPAALIAAAPYIGTAVGAIGGHLLAKNQTSSAQALNEEGSVNAWLRSEVGARNAFERDLKAYRQRYQHTMQDMKLAGLNPILAASRGFDVGSSVHSAAASSAAPFVSPVGGQNINFMSSARDYAQKSLMQSQTKKTHAETKNIIQDTAKKTQEVQKIIAQTARIRVEKGLVKAQERQALETYWKLYSEFVLNMKNAYLSVEKRSLTTAQTEQININAAKMTAELSKLRKIAKAYDGPAGTLIAYIDQVMDALNVYIGVGISNKSGRR